MAKGKQTGVSGSVGLSDEEIRKREEEELRIQQELEAQKQSNSTRDAIDQMRGNVVGNGGILSSPSDGEDFISAGSPFARMFNGGSQPTNTEPVSPAPPLSAPQEVATRQVAGVDETAPPTPQSQNNRGPILTTDSGDGEPNLFDRFFGKLGADTADKRSALGSSLMRAGAAMMIANDASGGSIGTILGSGINAGVNGYDKAIETQKQDEIDKLKLGQVQDKANVQKRIAEITKNQNWRNDPTLRNEVASLLNSVGQYEEANKVIGVAKDTEQKPYQFDKTYYDENGNQWTQRNNPTTGAVEFVNFNGERYDPSKHGKLSLEYSKRGQRDFKNDPLEKEDRNAETGLVKNAQQATRNIGLVDDIENLADAVNSGAAPGTGGFNETIKKVDSYLGGTNVLNGSAREKLEYLTQQQLAQQIETMRGLGPMTDKDLDMLRGRILSGNLTPDGIKSIGNDMRSIQRYTIQKEKAFREYRKSNPDAQYMTWSADYDEANYVEFRNDSINSLSNKKYDEAKNPKNTNNNENPKNGNIQEGKRGTYQGKPVVYRNGKWEYI